MQDRPTAAELLATLTEYLEGEVQPNVAGTLRYHTLVAANITRMLRREAELYPAAARRERRALAELLDRPSPGAEVGDDGEGDESDILGELGELNAELARRLREGKGDRAFEQRCWDVLFDAARDKLAISKPGYDSYDMADEVGRDVAADEVGRDVAADEVGRDVAADEVGRVGTDERR